MLGKAIGPEDCLEITVKDFERIGRNRLIGSVSIPLSGLLNTPSKELTAILNDANGRPTTVRNSTFFY